MVYLSLKWTHAKTDGIVKQQYSFITSLDIVQVGYFALNTKNIQVKRKKNRFCHYFGARLTERRTVPSIPNVIHVSVRLLLVLVPFCTKFLLRNLLS